MTDEEHKWIETNNSVCALLRQAHDVLAISSLPPKRTWVGLTDEEAQETFARHNCTISADLAGILARAIGAKLKKKNT
jgi:hypothetical protein